MHDFLREYEDLEDWISQQKQVASSDGYGTSYEHVLVSYIIKTARYIKMHPA